MSFGDREEKILNILYEKDTIRSSELAKILYVSVSTLRRDLEKLQEKLNISSSKAEEYWREYHAPSEI